MKKFIWIPIVIGIAAGMVFVRAKRVRQKENAPLPDRGIFELGVPVLGICYGLQVIGQFLGGRVERGLQREYGKGTLEVTDAACPLFRGLPRRLQVWNSHGDRLTRLPRGFKAVAVTDNSPYAAIEHRAQKIFGVQFHPEVVHTPRGREILANFVHRICGCGRTWTMRNYVEQAVEHIRRQVGGERVILGLSGGVDSSVAAALLHRAIGDQLTCIFVNNGLLRAREAEVVREVFGRHFKIRLLYEDASRLFLSRLRGVTDPERKRKIIGRTFIEVFEAATRRAGPARFLAQGTLYPDVIESVPIGGNPAALIKSHHNVGGLPRRMRFELVEPLKCLFKDEVRQLGLELGLPKEIVWRQPFPGPGLAVRIVGEGHPQTARNPAQRRRHRRRGDETQRLVLQNLAELRGVAAGAQRGRDGRRALLRLHDCDSRGGVAGRDDGGLGEIALRAAGTAGEPHHQRGARRQPVCVRHHQQTAGHHRMGISQRAPQPSAAASLNVVRPNCPDGTRAGPGAIAPDDRTPRS
jgi:GMP synthase (glutamine-hydrolysing) B subunit/GMP synthase (glutamine-hydrolysing) A subunit